MKTRLSTLPVAMILILTGCGSGQQPSRETVQIDVTKKYPEKEISLSDIADISYVNFDSTDDDYLFVGSPVSITQNTITIVNPNTGDIWFFCKDGRTKSYFNRRGNGPGEYARRIAGAAYDEQNDELFIHFQSNTISVYSSSGEYKRSLTLSESTATSEMYIYNDSSLLIYDQSKQFADAQKYLAERRGETRESEEQIEPPFMLVSRIDGSVIEHIDIPQDPSVDLSLSITISGYNVVMLGSSNRILKHKDGFLLCNQETGNVYLLRNDKSLTLLLEQTPLVNTLSPFVYVNNMIETGAYQFVEIVELVYDQTNRRGTPIHYQMRDKKDGSIYQPKFVLGDFKGKAFELTINTIAYTRNGKTGYIELQMDELQDAYDEGRLSGKLKDIVASMDEDANSLYVLLDFK